MARFVTNDKGSDSNDLTRQKMRSYWQVYSPTLESMMLSYDATHFAHDEQKEIVDYLPDYKGKRVLELGAGIGRFTASLAEVAGHVTAVDFMEQYIKENIKQHQHINNITYKCADVTRLDFPSGSFDLVFSNWLFMYLTDDESSQVCSRVLKWLVPGGYFFMRESCYHKSGNMKRNENPTLYRTPLDYSEMLRQVSLSEKVAYRIIRGKSILTYIEYHGNPYQLCFLAERVDETDGLTDGTGGDVTRYHQARHTLRYVNKMERIFGYFWLSSGGEYITKELVCKLGLVPGQRVLDVGCGTGGAAFYLARNYATHVHGVDLSTDMIHIAIERQGKLDKKLRRRIQFEMTDILCADYADESYDVIYSRDSLLFIKEKGQLFKNFYRWLKPGGTLFFTDYCSGTSHQLSRDFLNYVHHQRRYTLASVTWYAEELGRAGFEDIVAQDRHEDFTRILHTELTAFNSTRLAFVREFSEEEFRTISDGWKDKIQWSEEGQLSWGVFTATKRPTPSTTTTTTTNNNTTNDPLTTTITNDSLTTNTTNNNNTTTTTTNNSTTTNTNHHQYTDEDIDAQIEE